MALHETSPDLRDLTRPRDTLVPVAAALALAAMALFRVSGPVVDPDLWHEMALFREALAHGSMPVRDAFAYTPTLEPVVHHEWAAGALAYGVARGLEGPGLVALRYLLLFGLGAICASLHRAAQVPLAITAPMALLALLLVDAGFSTVRAQMYTFAALATLLLFFELDRRGRRGWIALWLVIYVAWANLHGGFLVGAGLFFLHWLEQWLRGKPHRHLLFTGIVMVPLALLTPWHVHYPLYLLRALTTDRSHIAEWGALGSDGDVVSVAAYAGSLLLLAYGLWTSRRQRRELDGLLLVLATAAYAASARRMLTLYGIVWFCTVPGYLAHTPLGSHLRRLRERRGLQLGFWGSAALVFAIAAWPAQPWRLRVPGDWDPALAPGHPIYPVGAVDYLAEHGFAGNLLVGFDWGAYASWKLHPKVKVSLDSRFEVAYPPEVEAEQYAFFHAESGWQQLLEQEPYRATDAILAPRFFDSRIHEKLAALPGWQRVYRDKRFELFARDGTSLPRVDLAGTREGAFP